MPLVLFSAPKGFSLGMLVFPSPQKPLFSSYQFDSRMNDSCELLGALWVNKQMTLQLTDYFDNVITKFIVNNRTDA